MRDRALGRGPGPRFPRDRLPVLLQLGSHAVSRCGRRLIALLLAAGRGPAAPPAPAAPPPPPPAPPPRLSRDPTQWPAINKPYVLVLASTAGSMNTALAGSITD